MSFLTNIKKAFGLSGDDYDELQDDRFGEDNVTAEELYSDRSFADAKSDAGSISADQHAASPTQHKDAEDIRLRIFDHVVDVFNESLPEFLKSSVNAEAQKKYLYDSLQSDLKAYLDAAEKEAQSKSENLYRKELAATKSEMEQLRIKSRKVDEQQRQLQETKLSTSRQRRALQERINDLENALQSAEADREQLDLENKSLMNKLRLASLSGVDPSDESNGVNVSVIEELDKIKAENKSLHGDIEQLMEKDRMATEMYTDMVNTLTDIKEQLRLKDEENEKLRKHLEQFEEIKEQLEQVEDIINRRDETIARLKEKNARLSSQKERVVKELARLESDRLYPEDMADDRQPLCPTPKITDISFDDDLIIKTESQNIPQSHPQVAMPEEIIVSKERTVKTVEAEVPKPSVSNVKDIRKSKKIPDKEVRDASPRNMKKDVSSDKGFSQLSLF